MPLQIPVNRPGPLSSFEPMRAPKIELLWWDGCPSHPRARADLEAVLRELEIDPGAVVEREVRTDADAADEDFVGSPTIRIDGRDIQPPHGEPAGLTCRIYRRRDGRISPTPDPEDIRDALREALG